MKNLIALVLLMLPAGGCIVEEGPPHRHRTVAVVEAGHVHCQGCGHVQIGGVWYVD